MKLLAFTDIHDNIKAFIKVLKKAEKEKPDIIISAGDLAYEEKDLRKVIKQLKQLKQLILLIPGNHEDPVIMEQLCSDNIIYLHKRTYSIGNYTFFGYGGGGFAQEDKKLESLILKIKKVAKEKLICITHMPPHNTSLDYLPISKRHTGSVSETKLIKELKPAIFICGHLHENFNKKDKMGKTLIINPGPEGEMIEV